jgi:extracellular factor (EF) 3-hydroxypalmitic acid methyl ester biosynthesis protein
MSRSILETTTYLDAWADSLCSSENVHPTIDELFTELNNIRLSVSTEDWRSYAGSTFREHRLHGMLLEDPFSRRAFEKPRGYAGDAETIDYIYAGEDSACLPDTRLLSPLGRRLYFEWMLDIDTCRAVRTRRAIIRTRLELLARERERPHVLSVACGHLREAVRCEAVGDRALGRFVALDQDPASLALVKADYAEFGVEAVCAGVGDIVRNKVALGDFDFVYATGLYDYLPTNVAQRLTSALFSVLRPGGTLLFANILPHVQSRGFLEACMDWWMVYRGLVELAQVASSIDDNLVAGIRTFADPLDQFAFLEAERRS